MAEHLSTKKKWMIMIYLWGIGKDDLAQKIHIHVDFPLPCVHIKYGSDNLPGSANQSIHGILYLNRSLQEYMWIVGKGTSA